MNQINTDQLKDEIEAWYETLGFIRHENVCLKNRLAKIVRNEINDDILNQAEIFQNSFINNDAIITLLKTDFNTHCKSLAEVNEIGFLAKIIDRQEKYREHMEQLEKEFVKQKNDFNRFAVKLIYNGAG